MQEDSTHSYGGCSVNDVSMKMRRRKEYAPQLGGWLLRFAGYGTASQSIGIAGDVMPSLQEA